ncbi:hypothetical protein BDZ45DRAFT_748515 [Acephala macrosclerotiorum]|nr:hypothetical protein BDZ45DRAFT_748515 [Acephala macrosclerotiorum]
MWGLPLDDPKPARISASRVVISVHGSCDGYRSRCAKTGWGVWLGSHSRLNSTGRVPEAERQTLDTATLYAVKRAIENVEDADAQQGKIKTIILKMNSEYVFNLMSTYI